MITPSSTEISGSAVTVTLAERVRTSPRAIALRYKHRGIWKEMTWRQLHESVLRASAGLTARGVLPGSVVGLFADNGPNWLIADLAIQRAGAVVLPLFPQTPAAEIAAWFSAHDVRIAVCGDEEHVDRIVESGASTVTDLIVIADAGLTHHPDPRLSSFAALGAADGELDDLPAPPDADYMIDVTHCESPADAPALVSVQAISESALAVAKWAQLSNSDRTFSILPLADVVTRVVDLYAPLIAGSTVHFGETLTSVPTDLPEARPTVLTGSAQVFELIRRDAARRGAATGRARRSLIGWGLRGSTRSGLRWAAVLRSLAKRHGVADVRTAIVVGDDAVSDPTRAFFSSLRVPISPLEGGEAVVAPRASVRSEDEAQFEQEIGRSPYISRSVVASTPEGYVAIVELDFEATASWANARKIEFTTNQSLAESDAVRQLLADEIVAQAAEGSPAIAFLGVAARGFGVAGGELAPGLWIRRGHVIDHHRGSLSAM